MGIAAIDDVLPDGGFPCGAVTEIAVLPSMGQTTSLALRLCAFAQSQARTRGGESAWCAWLDPSCTLYAPGVVAHGVTIQRLLVIRPPVSALARLAVRVVASQVFSVVVVDTVGVLGALVQTPLARWPNVVRRLALAAQASDICVVLLTDLQRSRSVSLPVALRLEVTQRSPDILSLGVTKERRGRITSLRDLAYTRPGEPLKLKLGA